ncbi:MAG: ABC transporter permease [Gemmatimonadales bacterium]|jgi:putative ABC transport system permease protein
MTNLAQDLRYAFRTLKKSPGFTAVVIIILAVGIGANVAMFSVTHAVFLEALPFQDPDRLILGRTTYSGQLSWNVSAEDYYDFRDQVQAFESLAAIRTFSNDGTVTGGVEPERVPWTLVSVNLFPTLGINPQLGRIFSTEEADLSAAPVVIISHGYWQRRYGGAPDVIGRTLVLDGQPTTIVGVMPAGFHLLYDADIWGPMQDGGPWTGVRRFHNWTVIGRLAPGVTLQEAQNEVDVVAARLETAYPESNTDKGLRILNLQAALVDAYDDMLWMLMGAIALVLLIACGNVAGLLLARGLSRSMELSVRAALGATGRRIARQLLTESLLLALAAGVLGGVLAIVLQRTMVGLISLDRLGIESVGVSLPMLLFAVGLSIATALVFGAAPAIHGARSNPAEDLKSGTRTTGSTGVARLRSGFVVFQVALSVVLLIGAGLLMRSFLQLRGVDPGFTSEQLLTARVSLPAAGYGDAASRVVFYTGLLEEIRAIPGVRAAGAISALPVKDGYSNVRAWNPDNPPADAGAYRIAEHRRVMPGYFEAMDIPILGGRDVEYTDGGDAEFVLVISESMGRDLFEGENPVGRQVAVDVGAEQPVIARVIGVVGDVRLQLTSDAPWHMYYSYRQSPVFTLSLAVRAQGDPGALTQAVRDVLRARDTDIPLANVQTMDVVLAESIASNRVVTLVLAVFAGVALILAALGLYSVLAYYVVRRANEIGIRLALGATPNKVLQLVLHKGLVLVTIGLVLGLGGAFGITRFIQQQLFGVQPTDPATFVTVGIVFLFVGTVACLVPGWRAVRVDPARTLQVE